MQVKEWPTDDPVKMYEIYLRLERGLSKNTVEAYVSDLDKLFRFVAAEGRPVLEITYADLQQFVAQLYDAGISPRSQARIISGIRSFYRYLVLEGYLQSDPTQLLESPRIGRRLPEVLTVGEIDRILAPLGRRLDRSSPIVNARLANGDRVNAVSDSVAINGPIVDIRKFSDRITSLDRLVEVGSLPRWYARLLSWAVRSRQDIAVAGGTGSGKTTLLNALSCEIDLSERIITIEDSAELRFSSHPDVVRLEARDGHQPQAG